MVTPVEVETALVLMANVAVVAPAATVTVAGTVADGLLLESATTRPPVGAALLSVTVPVEEAPPTTLVGLSARLATPGGDTVRVAVWVELP